MKAKARNMPTDRRFAQFQKDIVPPRMSEIPEGGVCLSVFIILSKHNSPNQVLMGRINKNAPWDHIGALDSVRVERHSKGWMLPSSHLILGEDPRQGASRILREQLGLIDQPVEGPRVFSEVTGASNHWDLEFVFLGERSNAPSHEAWSELKFVDLTRTRREEIARFHEDILAHMGKWKA
jgi:ADP-ribose pyrophosphatase YjhB (NUDIX family)